MEKTYIYSIITGVSKRLIAGVVNIKEKRDSYHFIGSRGITIAIIPKELSPLIILEKATK